MPDTTPADALFCIDRVECVACGACQMVAPDLIEVPEDVPEGGSYRFKRQPRNAAEESQAIAAINNCCVSCIYYRGDDPEIIRRICEVPVMSCHTHSAPQITGDLNVKQPRPPLQRIMRRLMMTAGATLFAGAILGAVFDPQMTALKAKILWVAWYAGAILFLYAKARS